MLFRFTCAVILVLLTALAGIALERENLALKRSVSLQHYRIDQLRERRAKLRLRIGELSGPRRFHRDVQTAPGEPEPRSVRAQGSAQRR